MKTIAEQHQQWCVHYHRDLSKGKDEACEKGVKYQELSQVKELGIKGSWLRLPCIRSHHDPEERRGQPLCPCPHLQWPTLEESAKHQDEVHDHSRKINRARAVIVNHIALTKRNNGSTDCPICSSGVLIYSKATCNGHINAACTNPGCVQWME